MTVWCRNHSSYIHVQCPSLSVSQVCLRHSLGLAESLGSVHLFFQSPGPCSISWVTREAETVAHLWACPVPAVCALSSPTNNCTEAQQQFCELSPRQKEVHQVSPIVDWAFFSFIVWTNLLPNWWVKLSHLEKTCLSSSALTLNHSWLAFLLLYKSMGFFFHWRQWKPAQALDCHEETTFVKGSTVPCVSRQRTSLRNSAWGSLFFSWGLV